jgi:hypothetical protein
MAESQPIKISYQPLIKSFPYTLFEGKPRNYRRALKSFMNQIVPNGIKVVLEIYQSVS